MRDRPRQFDWDEVPVAGHITIRDLIEGLGGGPRDRLLQFTEDLNGGLNFDFSIPHHSLRATRTVDSFHWGTMSESDRAGRIYLKLELNSNQ